MVTAKHIFNEIAKLRNSTKRWLRPIDIGDMFVIFACFALAHLRLPSLAGAIPYVFRASDAARCLRRSIFRVLTSG